MIVATATAPMVMRMAVVIEKSVLLNIVVIKPIASVTSVASVAVIAPITSVALTIAEQI